MDRFVIDVAKTNASAPGEAHATINVEFADGRPRVTELIIRAGGEGSLDSANLPIVDLLLRALSTDVLPPSGTVAAATVAPGRRAASAATRAPSGRPSRSRRARQSGRAYRRMPEPTDVLSAYQETGTITGLAEYFDVPLHTVKGWTRRLRQMGYEFSR